MSQLIGKFVWFECVTPDISRAKAFYGEVFGWKVQPFALGEGDYDMLTVGDTPIGGFVPSDAGAHPHWDAYISVANVDDALRAIQSAGGRTLVPAFDVPEVGRMAKIADPEGATAWVMRGRGDDAADTPPSAGKFTWCELWARNSDEQAAFYEQSFGYSRKAVDMPDGVYHLLERDGVPRAGVMQPPDADISPFWLPYVHVDDCERTAERVKKLGGTLHVPPTDVPEVGRFTVFADPLGATIAALEPPAR